MHAAWTSPGPRAPSGYHRGSGFRVEGLGFREVTQIPKEGSEVLDSIPDCFAWHVKSCTRAGSTLPDGSC